MHVFTRTSGVIVCFYTCGLFLLPFGIGSAIRSWSCFSLMVCKTLFDVIFFIFFGSDCCLHIVVCFNYAFLHLENLKA